MKYMSIALACGSLLLASCEQKATPPSPVTEAEMTTAFDAAKAAWISMDIAKVDSLYADDVVAFDVAAPNPVEGKAAMHKFNEVFIGMKFDAAQMRNDRLRALGPDAFIASGIAHFTSTAGQVKEADIRYSETFQKQADGSWKIVHEHIDFPPKEEEPAA